VIVRELKEKGGFIGFNAQTEKTEDMLKAGIVDPAKVTKSALQNAASIAGHMLTTEASSPKSRRRTRLPPAAWAAAAAWAECTKHHPLPRGFRARRKRRALFSASDSEGDAAGRATAGRHGSRKIVEWRARRVQDASIPARGSPPPRASS
jgi:hypothetical protein